MSGDYSRFTHNPKKRFTSVLNQQGRVALDADWNEAADMIRRRNRTQALDTFGPVGVPFATTPDGFKITAPMAGNFSIGRGRIYVDGLLAEIFGDERSPIRSSLSCPILLSSAGRFTRSISISGSARSPISRTPALSTRRSAASTQ